MPKAVLYVLLVMSCCLFEDSPNIDSLCAEQFGISYLSARNVIGDTYAVIKYAKWGTRLPNVASLVFVHAKLSLAAVLFNSSCKCLHFILMSLRMNT